MRRAKGENSLEKRVMPRVVEEHMTVNLWRVDIFVV